MCNNFGASMLKSNDFLGRSSPGTQGSGSCENQLFARLSNSRYLLGIYSPCEKEEFPIPYKNLCRTCAADYFECNVRRTVT